MPDPCLPALHTPATLRWSSKPVTLDADYIWRRVIPDEPNSGCWLWSGQCDRFGYGLVTTSKIRNKLAHRIAWTAFYGEIPADLVVRHRCDVPACCNPDHLELGTHLDNSRDCISRDRHARGQRSASAKLTDIDVVAIRKRVANGESQRQIAKLYGVDHSTIGSVCRGSGWRHLNSTVPPQGRGNRPGRFKLTLEQIEEARRRIAAGESLRSVGRSLGIGHRSISRSIEFLETGR